MRAILRATAIVLTIVMFLFAAAGSIRWAKRSTTGAQLLANAILLVVSIAQPVLVDPPQQGIEEAREDKGTKGAPSGDPPTA